MEAAHLAAADPAAHADEGPPEGSSGFDFGCCSAECRPADAGEGPGTAEALKWSAVQNRAHAEAAAEAEAEDRGRVHRISAGSRSSRRRTWSSAGCSLGSMHDKGTEPARPGT